MLSTDGKLPRWRRALAWPLTRLVLATLLIGLLRFPIVAMLDRGPMPADPVARDVIAKTLFLIAAVATWWLIGAFLERRPMSEIGFAKDRRRRDGLSGFALGVALISAVVATLAVAGWYRVTGSDFRLAPLSMALAWVVVAGLFEEVLFRAIFFRTIEEGLGSWPAVILAALLFGLVHANNPGATAISTTALVLAGAAFCLAYTVTRNLWFVAGLHIGWNFAEAAIYGLPLSGVSVPAVLQAEVSGPPMWTGGSFGPEAGLPAVVASAVSGAGFTWLAIRRRHLVPAIWARRASGSGRPELTAEPGAAADRGRHCGVPGLGPEAGPGS